MSVGTSTPPGYVNLGKWGMWPKWSIALALLGAALAARKIAKRR